MRILVTGGAGFIGSHVVEKLLEQGVEVYVYDLPFLRQGFSNQGRHVHSRKHPGPGIGAGGDGRNACRIPSRRQLPMLRMFTRDPYYAEAVNVRGTINVLEAARRAKVPRLIYGSTTWVYSEADDNVVDEDTPLKPPLHLYTATKLTSEYYCICYDKLLRGNQHHPSLWHPLRAPGQGRGRYPYFCE